SDAVDHTKAAQRRGKSEQIVAGAPQASPEDCSNSGGQSPTPEHGCPCNIASGFAPSHTPYFYYLALKAAVWPSSLILFGPFVSGGKICRDATGDSRASFTKRTGAEVQEGSKQAQPPKTPTDKLSTAFSRGKGSC